MHEVLEPVLIALEVTPEVLETTPTMFKQFHVKCAVTNGCLFIVEFSRKDPYGGWTSSLTAQANAWNIPLSYFAIRSDTIIGAHVPDLVLSIRGQYYHNLPPPHVPHHGIVSCVAVPMVIVELEVGNRSVHRMRRDFLQYFQDHPTLLGVVGIKMFGEEGNVSL